MKTYTEQIQDEDRVYYDLCLTKDGNLIRRRWKYYESKGEGEYIESDESSDLFDNLDHYCEIEDGFTLDHLCALVADNLDILNVTFKDCWLKEYIAEWERCVLTNSVKKCNEYNPDGVEYFELYRLDEMWNGYIHSSTHPSFHGIGFELKEDKWEDYDKENPAWKAGSRINWGISFMKMEDMLHIPIHINEEYHICRELGDNWTPENQFLFSAKKKMTLRDIIGGVFWEISFYGGPQSKEEEKEELDRRVDEFNEAKESGDFSKYMTVGSQEWDEFKDKLLSKGTKNEQ